MPRLPSGETSDSTLSAGLLLEPTAGVDIRLADAFEGQAQLPRRRRLLYQEWPGHNRFCCRGHIMMGPWEDWPCVAAGTVHSPPAQLSPSVVVQCRHNLCAWSSILVPSVSYLCAYPTPPVAYCRFAYCLNFLCGTSCLQISLCH
eukprot:COSAG02_NODE_9822_length_2100_cov_1.800100_4_plen_145_part_00